MTVFYISIIGSHPNGPIALKRDLLNSIDRKFSESFVTFLKEIHSGFQFMADRIVRVESNELSKRGKAKT